ncbi:MAG TPA: polysaccharide biosynthesis C-terminal domain-containing protein, partial [Pyrinomonadaceae bacterium]|nr:polysaccharide biosynthesis C-terminal domain-containing protein [Pyrinomonadaceae bacterium]
IASLRPDWFGFVSPELIRIASVQIPFLLLTLIGLNILLALGKLREFNLLDLVGQSFVLVNAILILIVFGLGLDALVKLNTITSVLISLVVVGLLVAGGKKLVDSKWRADAALLRRMIIYGLKFHVSVLAGAIIFRADLLVVNHFRGPAEAGVYSVATQFGLLLMLLPGVIATLLFPRVTAERDAHGETTWLVTRQTALIMLVCCLGAVPVSFLLPLVYGAAFSEATALLLILLPGVYLIGLESVLVQHFNARGLPHTIPIYWLVTLVVNLVLVFALVPQFGAYGAAIASTVSYALIFGLVAFYFQATTRRSVMTAARGSLRG